jgi:hypothetical protein
MPHNCPSCDHSTPLEYQHKITRRITPRKPLTKTPETTLDAIILEWHMGDENVAREMFADVIDTARKAERERCACIADALASDIKNAKRFGMLADELFCATTAAKIAQAIRSMP